MARLEDKSINQIMLQVIGPALIVCMVASLVFFFIEVMYRGPHTARLYWVMGLFTAASVLVSRIAIEEGRERAQLFGLALAAATMVASLRLVEFTYVGLPLIGPLVIAALIAIVLWTTSKLTWDCTVVDRSRDVSSVGLIENFRRRLAGQQPTDAADEPARETKNWLTNLFSGSVKQNTPGMWVFYFAIFAFPVFGIGQWFVQPESSRWIFVLFATYLGATLGLLMITSLLGLERYLAKRDLHVPPAVTRNWLMVGGAFALLVMLTVMLVPAPASSRWTSDWLAKFTSPLREANHLALGNDGQRNEPDAEKKQVDPDADEPSSDPGDQQNDTAVKKGSGESSSGKNQQQGEPSKSNDSKSNSESEGQENANPENAKDPPEQKRGDQQNNRAEPEDAQPQNNQQQRQANRQQEPPGERRQRQAQRQSSSSSNEGFSRAVRAFMWLLGLLSAAYLAWMFRNEIAAFLSSLKKKPRKEIEPAETKRPVSVPLPSFRSFQDPFTDGRVNSLSARQIAGYSMSALEAWGREFAVPRVPDSTPHEFARSLTSTDAELARLAAELAELYGRCAFSGETVSRVELKPLVNLWRRMTVLAASVGQQKLAAPVP